MRYARLGMAVVFIVTVSAASAETDHDGGKADAGKGGKAAPKPCSFDAVTNSCEAFNPKTVGPRIMSPKDDGTYLPNYARISKDRGKDGPKKAYEEGQAQNKERIAANLKLTGKMFGILNGFDEKKLSAPLKIFLTQFLYPSESIRLVLKPTFIDRPKEGDEDKKIELPWPPDDASGAVKSVSLPEVRSKLLEVLGDKRKEITEVVNEFERINGMDNFRHSEEEKKNDVVSKTRMDRVNDLFRIAKEKVIEVIQRGRPYDKLSDPEKRAVDKVKAVTMGPYEQMKNHFACLGIAPNAFYSPIGVNVSICPAFYNYPDATILSVLGHEIGHSIDPCNAQCASCSVDREKLRAAEMPESDQKLAKLHFFLKDVVAHEDSTKISLPMDLYWDKGAIEKYKEKGIFKEDSPGTPFDQYVLKDVYGCLSSEKGGGFQAFSNEEMEKLAQKLAERTAKEKVGVDREKYIATKKAQILGVLTKYPECMRMGASSHMGEAIADWIGGKVLGSYLKDQRAKGEKLDTPTAKLETIGFFASIVCMKHFNEKEGETDIGEIYEAHGRLSDPHPASKSRMEDIMLRNNDIREALGCPPDDRECLQNELEGDE